MSEKSKPRRVAGMGAGELAAAKPGDEFEVEIPRAPEYRLAVVDDVLFTATQFDQLDVVFTRTEPLNYTRRTVVRANDATTVSLEVLGVSSTQVTQSVTHCRMPFEAGTHMAVAMVKYLAENSALSKATLREQLRELLASDD